MKNELLTLKKGLLSLVCLSLLVLIPGCRDACDKPCKTECPTSCPRPVTPTCTEENTCDKESVTSSRTSYNPQARGNSARRSSSSTVRTRSSSRVVPVTSNEEMDMDMDDGMEDEEEMA
jgi:hypothetical protein